MTTPNVREALRELVAAWDALPPSEKYAPYRYIEDENKRIDKALSAARAALAAMDAVPPGYKLVPIEPTIEMLEAGHKVSLDTVGWDRLKYQAMIAAAPPNAAEQEPAIGKAADMPPLPEPSYGWVRNGYVRWEPPTSAPEEYEPIYSSDQMHAYARAYAEQETAALRADAMYRQMVILAAGELLRLHDHSAQSYMMPKAWADLRAAFAAIQAEGEKRR